MSGTDITTDNRRISIRARGREAIAAAEAGADLWAATPDGWEKLIGERREWVLRRARIKRSKVSVDLFGSTCSAEQMEARTANEEAQMIASPEGEGRSYLPFTWEQ